MTPAADRILDALTDAQLTYAQTEAALGDIYLISESNISKIRARYKHFQKLELLKRKPGTGSKQKFTITEFCTLLLAMELSEFGLDPIDIVRISDGLFGIKSKEPLSSKTALTVLLGEVLSYASIRPRGHGKYFVFAPKAMSSRWLHKEDARHYWPESWSSWIVERRGLSGAIDSIAQERASAACVIDLTALGVRAAEALIPHLLVI